MTSHFRIWQIRWKWTATYYGTRGDQVHTNQPCFVRRALDRSTDHESLSLYNMAKMAMLCKPVMIAGVYEHIFCSEALFSAWILALQAAKEEYRRSFFVVVHNSSVIVSHRTSYFHHSSWPSLFHHNMTKPAMHFWRGVAMAKGQVSDSNSYADFQ